VMTTEQPSSKLEEVVVVVVERAMRQSISTAAGITPYQHEKREMTLVSTSRFSRGKRLNRGLRKDSNRYAHYPPPSMPRSPTSIHSSEFSPRCISLAI
jgi:hypothetical protein